VGRFSLYKSNLSELCLTRPRKSCRSWFETVKRISLFHFNVYFYQWTLLSISGKFANKFIYTQYFNTRNEDHLRRPNANPSCFQKDTSYAAIKIFNSLPCSL